MFLIQKQYIGNLGIPGKIKAAPQALENAIHPKRFFQYIKRHMFIYFHYYN